MHPLLIFWLAFAPPQHAYGEAVEELQDALTLVGEADSSVAIKALARAIDRIGQFPEDLPDDAKTLANLDKARMSLVWLHVIDSSDTASVDAMDEALRSARGRTLSPGSFGAKVYQLHDQRLKALEDRGTAIIEVDCRIPCEVVINERRSANPSDPLFLGRYRVWVGSRDGSVEWAYFDANLTNPTQTVSFVYQGAAATPEMPEGPVESTGGNKVRHEPGRNTPNGPAKSARRRMLPRWSEILGLSVGVGLLVSGVVVLSLTGKCPGGIDPSDTDACPQVWNNQPQGYALVGTGAGFLLISGVLLTVDEVRVSNSVKAKRVMLGWTIRF